MDGSATGVGERNAFMHICAALAFLGALDADANTETRRRCGATGGSSWPSDQPTKWIAASHALSCWLMEGQMNIDAMRSRSPSCCCSWARVVPVWASCVAGIPETRWVDWPAPVVFVLYTGWGSRSFDLQARDLLSASSPLDWYRRPHAAPWWTAFADRQVGIGSFANLAGMEQLAHSAGSACRAHGRFDFLLVGWAPLACPITLFRPALPRRKNWDWRRT